MKRQIIKIDEDKCNGCGLCVPNCPEGALQVINGKARLVGELLCDGLGACIGNCPEGAITIEEREAEKYDERKVMENVVKAGKETIIAHLEHLKSHGQDEYLNEALKYLKEKNIPVPEKKTQDLPLPCGCPTEHGEGMPNRRRAMAGTMMKDFRKQERQEQVTNHDASGPVKSELRQWPTQLHLVNPAAPYFQNADLLVAADCTAFTFGDFHRKFLKDKTLVMFCPKLDDGMEMYLEKLTNIIKNNNIKSITVVKMEVPCCGGALRLTEEALQKSGKNIVLKEYTISIRGEIV